MQPQLQPTTPGQAAPQNPPRAPADRAPEPPKSPTALDLWLWACGAFEGFCGLLDIVPKSGLRQKLTLNEIQIRYLLARTPRDIALKPRQIGFTTEELARDIWHFLTRPGARVQILCQSEKDDKPRRKIVRDTNLMFDSLRRLGLKLPFGASTSGEWTLPKRDAVMHVASAGASTMSAGKKRGDTVTRLHATEVAFWDCAEASLNAIEESIVSPELGGEVIQESTPNGYGGKFYDNVMAATAGKSGYKLHFFPWWLDTGYRVELAPGEVVEPLNDREVALFRAGCLPEQVKWRRQKIAAKGSEALVDQEYPSDPDTCFLKGGRMYFVQDACVLHRSLCRPHLRIDQRWGLRVWEEPIRGEEYVIGADTSEGIPEPGKDLEDQPHDPSAAVVRKRRTGEHVATVWGMFRPSALAEVLKPVGQLYNHAWIGVERNNHGHAVLLWLEHHLGYKRVFHDRDGRAGWLNTAPARTAALDLLQREHAKGKDHYSTPDAALVKQQFSFIVGPDGTPRAANGAHDDLVLADAIAWDLVCRPLLSRSTRHLPPA